MYAGNAAGDDPPDGWLYCNGDTIGQTSGDHTGTELQNLFNLLSASALWENSGSEAWASATVKLPDFRSRAPVGIHTGAANSITAGLTARALSATAGTETHTLTTAQLAAHTHASTIVASATGQSISTITANQSGHTHTSAAHTHTSAAHTHAFTTSTDGNHNHTLSQSHLGGPDPIVTNRIKIGGSNNYGNAPLNDAGSHQHTGTTNSTTPGSTGSTTPGVTGTTDPAITISGGVLGGETHTHTLTAASTGSGTAHNNLSPIIAVNYIIKV
jgi:microcystin-dependent protein